MTDTTTSTTATTTTTSAPDPAAAFLAGEDAGAAELTRAILAGKDPGASVAGRALVDPATHARALNLAGQVRDFAVAQAEATAAAAAADAHRAYATAKIPVRLPPGLVPDRGAMAGNMSPGEREQYAEQTRLDARQRELDAHAAAATARVDALSPAKVKAAEQARADAQLATEREKVWSSVRSAALSRLHRSTFVSPETMGSALSQVHSEYIARHGSAKAAAVFARVRFNGDGSGTDPGGIVRIPAVDRGGAVRMDVDWAASARSVMGI